MDLAKYLLTLIYLLRNLNYFKTKISSHYLYRLSHKHMIPIKIVNFNFIIHLKTLYSNIHFVHPKYFNFHITFILNLILVLIFIINNFSCLYLFNIYCHIYSKILMNFYCFILRVSV